MHYLIAAIYFLFSLVGCDGIGAHDIVTRATDRGIDVLYSEASITPLRARFSCVSSVTGHCHYHLFSVQCQNPSRLRSGMACERKPLQNVVVASGQLTELTGLPTRFGFCVNQNAKPTICRSAQQAGLGL